MNNQYFVLANRSEGIPKESDFLLKEGDIPACLPGGLLLENLYLTLDPYIRGRIAGRHISGTINPGDVMPGETVARVLESQSDDFKSGDLVKTMAGGWQTHVAVDAAAVTAVSAQGLSPSLTLGVLGMPGLTAYAGMTRLADLVPGDTVLVSAAAGPVGSTVGQIARIAGCKVIGIAGGAEKCAWVEKEAGFHHCLDYKAGDIGDMLDRAAPEGIHVYFDNVGGEILNAAMMRLAIGARVILCGLMAQYNSDTPLPGPNPGLIIKARATVRGLVVYDHWDLADVAGARIADWIKADQFAVKEDISTGIETAAAQFVRLMEGKNFGKSLVQIAKTD